MDDKRVYRLFGRSKRNGAWYWLPSVGYVTTDNRGHALVEFLKLMRAEEEEGKRKNSWNKVYDAVIPLRTDSKDEDDLHAARLLNLLKGWDIGTWGYQARDYGASIYLNVDNQIGQTLYSGTIISNSQIGYTLRPSNQGAIPAMAKLSDLIRNSSGGREVLDLTGSVEFYQAPGKCTNCGHQVTFLVAKGSTAPTAGKDAQECSNCGNKTVAAAG